MKDHKCKRLTKQLILAGSFPELRELLATTSRNKSGDELKEKE